MRNKVLQEDLERLLASDFIDFDKLRNTKLLITGATGLIGSNLVSALTYLSEERGLNIHIDCLVRNKGKAEKILDSEHLAFDCINFIEADMTTWKPIKGTHYDHILHLASPTDSSYFLNHAVELIQLVFNATSNMLEATRDTGAAFHYFSSMEVYGTPHDDSRIHEDFIGSAPLTMSARSSYSEGKRLCETLCRAYFEEHDTPVNVLRLTQTIGPGIASDDKRVFAQFARCAANKEDIVLKTKGGTKRSYVYTMDAVAAVLTIMTKGTRGEAYNIANEDAYCSILDMANMVAKEIADDKISVLIREDATAAKAYLPDLCMNLDCSKLRSLGWKPSIRLKDMYLRMMAAGWS